MINLKELQEHINGNGEAENFESDIIKMIDFLAYNHFIEAEESFNWDLIEIMTENGGKKFKLKYRLECGYKETNNSTLFEVKTSEDLEDFDAIMELYNDYSTALRYIKTDPKYRNVIRVKQLVVDSNGNFVDEAIINGELYYNNDIVVSCEK